MRPRYCSAKFLTYCAGLIRLDGGILCSGVIGLERTCSRGDLNALVELKRGWGVPSPTRRERLGERGFIEELDDHKLRVTMKGRVALLLGRR